MFITYDLCVGFRRAQEKITQDAEVRAGLMGKVTGVWSLQPSAGGVGGGRWPRGFHLSREGDRKDPKTEHMLRHTYSPPTCTPRAGEENKYTQTPSHSPGAWGRRGQQVSFLLSILGWGQRNAF